MGVVVTGSHDAHRGGPRGVRGRMRRAAATKSGRSADDEEEEEEEEEREEDACVRRWRRWPLIAEHDARRSFASASHASEMSGIDQYKLKYPSDDYAFPTQQQLIWAVLNCKRVSPCSRSTGPWARPVCNLSRSISTAAASGTVLQIILVDSAHNQMRGWQT